MGVQSNRDAIGARVTVHGSTRNWVDEVRSGSSYNSSSDLRLHFGLGTVATLTGVTVRWPNGGTEEFAAPRVDGFAELVEGKGKAVSPAR